MKRFAVIALALLVVAGLAGCTGDDIAGLEYDFEGSWRFTYTVVGGNAFPVPAGGSFSELVRIREEGGDISLTLSSGVMLEGTSDSFDGTFSVFDSGTSGDTENPVEWEIEYVGAALDDRTMSGTVTITYGSAVSSATWVAELQVR